MRLEAAGAWSANLPYQERQGAGLGLRSGGDEPYLPEGWAGIPELWFSVRVRSLGRKLMAETCFILPDPQ